MEVRYLLSIISAIHIFSLGFVTWLIKSWIQDVKKESKDSIEKIVELQLKINTLETAAKIEHKGEQ